MPVVGRYRWGLRTVHEILSYLWCPGVLIGGLFGVALLLFIHWLWPGLNPAIGALILVSCCVGGIVVENVGGTPRKP
jgi:hypothetical protein